MSTAFSLTESDLHGIVDGRLEASRRADALRALATSPADRARVDAWQEQNDLIKSAFFGIEKESIPAALRLVAPPSLHCVPSPVTSLPLPRATSGRRRHIVAGFVVIALLAAGLGGAWLLQQGDDTAPVVDLRLRGPVDESLAKQTADAVTGDAARRIAKAGTDTPSGPLPTTSIPDLSPAGFVFTSAESRTAEPSSLVFHYRNAAAERLVISVARAPQAGGESGPTRIGRTFSWHRGENAFAIAGTVRPDRLRAIATLLHGTAAEE